MEHLWAPWRAEYFTHKKPAGCIFCFAASQKDNQGNPSDDASTFLLLRDRTCFAMLNAYPYNTAHLMVAPYRHTGNLDDLTEDEMRDMMILARRCRQIIERAYRPHGFNLGLNLGAAAGAGITEHLHLHVVPRWNGDTNFMTVINDSRVVALGLKHVFEKLKQAIPNG